MIYDRKELNKYRDYIRSVVQIVYGGGGKFDDDLLALCEKAMHWNSKLSDILTVTEYLKEREENEQDI